MHRPPAKRIIPFPTILIFLGCFPQFFPSNFKIRSRPSSPLLLIRINEMRKPIGAGRARISLLRYSMPPLSPRFAAEPRRASSAAPRRWLSTLLIIAAIALPCVVLYRAASPTSPFPMRTSSRRSSSGLPIFNFDAAGPAELESEDVRLERVLKEAATENKTVILTTVNAAWASPGSILDLFIESFRVGDGTRKLLDHLVMIALDEKAYLRCLAVHAHCFALITVGMDFSDEKVFMSAGYLSMMWRRIEILRVVLEMGYNFIFSDADILWLRNPLPQLSPEEDFQIACDHFNGNAFDLQNVPNGGFNYVKSNIRTIQFYKFWYASRAKYPGYHDQDVLNFIKFDPFLMEIGIKIRFLSTAFFGGLCEPSRDFSKFRTMHTNCCIGLSRKVNDLRVMLNDWRTYMSLPWKVKRYGAYSWRVPQFCSLAPLDPSSVSGTFP